MPFFLKPILNLIVGPVNKMFIKPNYETHLAFLESQLASSPDGGEYFCGKELTGADGMMWFPIEAAKQISGMNGEDYPKVWRYADRIQEREAYKRAVERIVEVEGQFKMKL